MRSQIATSSDGHGVVRLNPNPYTLSLHQPKALGVLEGEDELVLDEVLVDDALDGDIDGAPPVLAGRRSAARACSDSGKRPSTSR